MAVTRRVVLTGIAATIVAGSTAKARAGFLDDALKALKSLGGETDALMHKFNDSIYFDVRMWEADLDGSMAYAKTLARAGIITEEEI